MRGWCHLAGLGASDQSAVGVGLVKEAGGKRRAWSLLETDGIENNEAVPFQTGVWSAQCAVGLGPAGPTAGLGVGVGGSTGIAGEVCQAGGRWGGTGWRPGESEASAVALSNKRCIFDVGEAVVDISLDFVGEFGAGEHRTQGQREAEPVRIRRRWGGGEGTPGPCRA